MNRPAAQIIVVIEKIEALPRYDAAQWDDAAGGHLALKETPNGCYYLVDDITRLLTELKGTL